MIKEKITIYYDKECPFCNSYVGYLKLKDSYELILKNVREDKNIDIDKSKNLTKDKIDKKPIDIFANLKTKDSKTALDYIVK